jgi:trehalose synthase
MSHLQHVPIETMDPRRFETVLSSHQYDSLVDLIDHGARALRGRVIWNVNSTAKGGGVVELLRPLLGYSRGADVDARWVVVSGHPEFFALTKRIHNHLHGFAGDGGEMGEAERLIYESTLAPNATEFARLVSPTDIVMLIPAVRATGATIIWRCHVGLDRPNDYARKAWDFLRPYVVQADAYVFSRRAFAWEGLDPDKLTVIQPTVDAFCPKNAEQTPEQSLSILAAAGIVKHDTSVAPSFV